MSHVCFCSYFLCSADLADFLRLLITPVWYLLMLFVLHSHQVSDDSDVSEHPLERLLSVKNKRLY